MGNETNPECSLTYEYIYNARPRNQGSRGRSIDILARDSGTRDVSNGVEPLNLTPVSFLISSPGPSVSTNVP